MISQDFKDFPLSDFDHIWLYEAFTKTSSSALFHPVVSEILGRYTGSTQHEFSYGQHGKPCLKNRAHGINFSLSHSGERLIVMISQDEDIGVDIELLKARRFSASIAKKYFKEARAPDAFSFYRAWTAREAFLKSRGLSLAAGLARIDVKDELIGLDGSFSHRLSFKDLAANYLAAICQPLSSRKELVWFSA